MNLSEFILYLAPVIGAGAFLIGVMAVIKPEKMSKQFGISVGGNALPYVVSTGIRDVFIGLVVLFIYYFKDQTLLGWTQLAIGVVAVSDFIVVMKYGNKKTALIHLFGAVLVFVYGIWLITSSTC